MTAAPACQGSRFEPEFGSDRPHLGNTGYYNRLDKGGHFAAWEQPKIFAAEPRAAFRSLR
jgi:hypothetical protein